MTSMRRSMVNRGSSGKLRDTTPAVTGSRKRAPTKKGATTRTSLIGMTIYQPDVEPSPQARKLLDALEG